MDQLVTREGELFQVSDPHGDFTHAHPSSGLFTRDTRFLSLFELYVNGARPQVLMAEAADNYVQRIFAGADVVDRALTHNKELGHTMDLGVERGRVLHDGVMYERIGVTNYGRQPHTVRVELRYNADFVDLFEVRGLARERQGEHLPPRVSGDEVVLGYRGLDGILRETRLRFLPPPETIAGESAAWHLELPARGTATIEIAVSPAENGAFPDPTGYDHALSALASSYAAWRQQCTIIESDSPLLNRVLERSMLDLRILLADRGHGPFPVAGIPWFAVPFGRDSLIAAIQTLALNPQLARGTLRTMAAWQGRSVDTRSREEPGKIPHELRSGEMSNLGEVPFKRYYGSVDSTPLFLVLLCDYYAWSGDLDLVRELLPNVRAALDWLDRYGDADGDSLLEYHADREKGLVVQSWKDSHDSMSHRNGRPAASPVAVSEAQGYAYDAKRRLAPILKHVGESALAQRLTEDAERLRQRFNTGFWMEDRQYLAIALDGAKERVGTVASDAGHCLWSGIVEPEHAAQVARRLLAPDMFTGWGIRTLSGDEVTYNPMSYHNGSVWPHDNSLCVLGLKRYGFDEEANAVASGLLDAATRFDDFRLPELFCGYARDGDMPITYPVACSPQAWAAATPLVLMQVMLGLQPDAAAGVLRLRPRLPNWLGRITLRGLRIGTARLDLDVTRDGVRADVLEGTLTVVVDDAQP